MLLLLEINFLHLILPVALLLAGWPPPLPRTHPFHRGEGGWCYDHDHGRGGGGGTRNLEHIYTYICIFYCHILSLYQLTIPNFHGPRSSHSGSKVTTQSWRLVRKDACRVGRHFLYQRLIHFILNLELIRLLEVLLWSTCVVPTPAENEWFIGDPWWTEAMMKLEAMRNLGQWQSAMTIFDHVRFETVHPTVRNSTQCLWDSSMVTILPMKPIRFEPTVAQLLLQPLHSILDGKKTTDKSGGDSERLSLAKNGDLAPRRWLMALAMWQHPICKSSPVCGNALVGSPR